MKQPKELSSWDFSETIEVRDGYDTKSVPDITRNNLNTLIDEHNNLVKVVNLLCEKHHIIFNG